MLTACSTLQYRVHMYRTVHSVLCVYIVHCSTGSICTVQCIQFCVFVRTRLQYMLYTLSPPSTPQLYRVVYPFTARTDHPDEIDLREGGFVYISTVDNGRTESDGWLRGTSYTTGMTGVFPANYIEKTKESDVWPLHR